MFGVSVRDDAVTMFIQLFDLCCRFLQLRRLSGTLRDRPQTWWCVTVPLMVFMLSYSFIICFI